MWWSAKYEAAEPGRPVPPTALGVSPGARPEVTTFQLGRERLAKLGERPCVLPTHS